jgi:tetratricopeptide (TPR) repeat protein
VRHGATVRLRRTTALLAPALLVACTATPDRRTLAELRTVEADVTEMRVENSLDEAIRGYDRFLEEAPESTLTPEAMRRLADLKLEKEFGLLADGEIVEQAAPASAAEPGPPAVPASMAAPQPATPMALDRPRVPGLRDARESTDAFEDRVSEEVVLEPAGEWFDAALPESVHASSSGPAEAIALYDRILTDYPHYAQNDQVLYQKARAYDELGRPDEAVAVLGRLIAEHPASRHVDEAWFRRAEYFFTRRRWLDAEEAYAAIARGDPSSDYYELALYKLGWTYYKQELHEEALGEYIALLDHKVATGYDFDQTEDEDTERRIADTHRVISLSFSNLGGPDVVREYFAEKGPRSYEDRIYSHLGEFYLEKLRYEDAARSYKAFVDLHPLHRKAPHFGMRVVEVYETAGFPILVLEAKKEFAARYALDAAYWRHFAVEEAPEVLAYLKANLVDLASHHHSLYQDEELVDERPANFDEATRWYRAYLDAFASDAGAPGVNHRLADLLLENGDFADAAREYERTAYDYPAHEQAGAAGYAAIFAHREQEKHAPEEAREAARSGAVTSSLRFVERFPGHEHAASVLGAAVDDLYEMKAFDRALAHGQQLIDAYPEAGGTLRRRAWTVVAHASLELTDYVRAEQAYGQVLSTTPADDPSRASIEDNLAAAIYKQGEQASEAGENRAAAEHFLRVAAAAPRSGIRASAEYDAAAALIRLEDWAGAAAVLEAFRETHPDHELAREATKQIARVYREQGDVLRAATETERIADEAEDAELERNALLVAAGLYDDASARDRALAVRLRYVEAFPAPVETAVSTRATIAEAYAAQGDETRRLEQLERIVAIDAGAGRDRTERVRFLAARAALVLAERRYERFTEIALVQPLEAQLREKQQRIHGRDLRRLQRGAPRLGAAERPHAGGARGVRARARGGGLPVRGAGDRGAREEPRAAPKRALQRLGREEPRPARGVDAGPVREARAQQRPAGLDRGLRLPAARPAGRRRRAPGGGPRDAPGAGRGAGRGTARGACGRLRRPGGGLDRTRPRNRGRTRCGASLADSAPVSSRCASPWPAPLPTWRARSRASCDPTAASRSTSACGSAPACARSSSEASS